MVHLWRIARRSSRTTTSPIELSHKGTHEGDGTRMRDCWQTGDPIDCPQRCQLLEITICHQRHSKTPVYASTQAGNNRGWYYVFEVSKVKEKEEEKQVEKEGGIIRRALPSAAQTTTMSPTPTLQHQIGKESGWLSWPRSTGNRRPSITCTSELVLSCTWTTKWETITSRVSNKRISGWICLYVHEGKFDKIPIPLKDR